MKIHLFAFAFAQGAQLCIPEYFSSAEPCLSIYWGLGFPPTLPPLLRRSVGNLKRSIGNLRKSIRILNKSMANLFSSNSNAEQISAGKPVLGGRGFSPNWQDFKRSWSNIYWNCGLQLEIRSILGPGPQHTWVNNSGRCLGTQVCCQCVRVSIL